jgi:hypothetical protein
MAKKKSGKRKKLSTKKMAKVKTLCVAGGHY